MSEVETPSTPRRRSLSRRRAGSRAAGLALVLVVVGLPMFSLELREPVVWATVPLDGFAATTAWRIIGTEGDTITYDLTSFVGHNMGGTNEFQVHESTNFTVTAILSDTLLIEHYDDTPTITMTNNLTITGGGCCGSPHAICNDDGTCQTPYTASNGQFTIVVYDPDTGASSQEAVDPGASNQQSSTADKVGGGIVMATSDFVADALELYHQADGGSDWDPFASHPCGDVFTTQHFGTAANAQQPVMWTLCSNGANARLRQVNVPGGGIPWNVSLGSMPTPTAFQYLQIELCKDVQFPDSSSGDAIFYVLPQNPSTRVGMTGPVGQGSPPAFDVNMTFPGSPGDLAGTYCNGNVATWIRPDPDGSGTQFHYLNFGNLSAEPNVMLITDNNLDSDWVNVPPPYATGASPSASIDVQSAYLPFILKNSGSLEGGGAVVYGDVPTVLFFDGFESGDTLAWDATVD